MQQHHTPGPRTILCLVAVLAALYAVAGTLTYATVRQYHAHTCRMIAQGHWPSAVEPSCNTEAHTSAREG